MLFKPALLSHSMKWQSSMDQLEEAADQATEACGGDARQAIKALIVVNHFLETDLEKLRAAVSTGYPSLVGAAGTLGGPWGL